MSFSKDSCKWIENAITLGCVCVRSRLDEIIYFEVLKIYVEPKLAITLHILFV